MNVVLPELHVPIEADNIYYNDLPSGIFFVWYIEKPKYFYLKINNQYCQEFSTGKNSRLVACYDMTKEESRLFPAHRRVIELGDMSFGTTKYFK